MVQMVTPSPTPSADGSQHLPTSAMPNTSNPWPDFTMCESSNGQWDYGTPPLEDSILYNEHTLRSASNDQFVSNVENHPPRENELLQVPSWPSTHGLALRPRALLHRGYNAEQKHDDDRERAPPRPTRASKRPTARSRRKDKAIRFPDLKVPLSVWAMDNNIEPLDVAEFATRDIESRIARAIKDGYIKRNLNIFFLYKRAYSKVAQAWMAKHHPSLSKTQPPLVTLVGESWKRESASFKDSYSKYSDLERDGLKAAFPDYKYKPNMKKAQVTEDEPDKAASTLKRHQSELFVDPAEDWPRRLYGSGPGTFNEPAVLSSREPLYHASVKGMPPMPTVHESGPMISDQATAFLQPGLPGWPLGMNDGTARSVSPVPSQLSYQTTDPIPIDPNLPDAVSDYVPSRGVSEEPGFVAPSQLTYSRMPSAEPMRSYPNEPDNSGDWLSNPAMSRCASEEPWQGMPDAFLSSLPTNDMLGPASNDQYWQLETLEKNEPLQGFAWDAEEWEHDF